MPTRRMDKDFEEHYRELLRRRRFLRKLLRPLPRRANVRRYPVIKWFAAAASRYPFLWSFKRAHVLPALYAGAVLAMLPLYGFQLVLAFFVAVLTRANLTITVGLQFITNPFTLVPIYGVTGLVGHQVMGVLGIGSELPRAVYYGNALFVGGVIVGLGVALVADMAWRLGAWEAKVFRRRVAASRARRAAAAAAQQGESEAG
jgi:uncharacterized protein